MPRADPAQRFADAGLPFTLQRRAIWEAFAGRVDHPTADAVFEAVSTSTPGISRTTVYRTLETLVQLGLAHRIASPGPAARYDPKTGRHHHLICKECNRVIDVQSKKLDELRLPPSQQQGFEIEDYSVHFTGVCRSCHENKSG